MRAWAEGVLEPTLRRLRRKHGGAVRLYWEVSYPYPHPHPYPYPYSYPDPYSYPYPYPYPYP